MSRDLYLAIAVMAAAVLSFAAGAAAQTCTATMTDMNFGNVEVALNQNVDITGTVSINCTGANLNGQLRLCLHLCEGSGGMDASDAHPRTMNNSSGLQYNIYQDGGLTQV